MPDIGIETLSAETDGVQPFQIEATALRGRLVRMGPLLDSILDERGYPEAVAGLLGETILLAALMASALKYEGVFTLQAKGEGPVSLVVADITSEGHVRAYAQFDDERLPASGGGVTALLGEGYLAFTVDQGPHTHRYQGIVELTGETLASCLQHYFRQSEQLDAAIKLSLDRERNDVGPKNAAPGGRWRGGAMMLQRLPEPGAVPPPSDREDGWRRAMVLMESATNEELESPDIAPERLLYRLFHEDGVRIYPARTLIARCRCSRDKVAGVLGALPEDDTGDLAEEDGLIHVTCEFCGTDYAFDRAQLAQLRAEGRPT